MTSTIRIRIVYDHAPVYRNRETVPIPFDNDIDKQFERK